MTQEIITTITNAGGREWKERDKHRIYLDAKTAYELAGGSVRFYATGSVSSATLPAYEEEHGGLSNRRAYVQSVYYDVIARKFHAQGTDVDVVSCLVDQLTTWLDTHSTDSEAPVYTLTVTHRPMQRDDFTYTGALVEIVKQIEADVFHREVFSGSEKELMAEIEATEDEAEELSEEGLSVEPGQTIWELFDETLRLQKPQITPYLVRRYASHVYDAHIRHVTVEKSHTEAE